MPNEITIPRLGWNMDEGVFVAWLKNDGEFVKAGEPIFSLESDKAVQEIESLDSGRLKITPGGPSPGQTVAVGTVIGFLLQSHETESIPGKPSAAPEPKASPPPGKWEPAAQAGSPDGEGVADRAASAAPPHSSAPPSSPRARRRARAMGIDWTTLAGTGRSGRIRERDVLAATAIRPRAVPPSPARPDHEYQVVPVDATRRVIAERMMQGAHAAAPVTLTTSIDATNLVNLRQQFKAAVRQVTGDTGAAVVGYGDIVVKLAALALEKHPILNSRWDGDRILIFRAVHVGLAVDTDAGLLVPVLRDVTGLTLRQLAERSRDLIARARRRALRAEELQGGTFTVTNLGPFGIDAFTPIINVPQCAVLGMGRILRQPVASENLVTARDRMTLSLTFDHRITDGAPAARFLQELGGMLENPSPWLMP